MRVYKNDNQDAHYNLSLEQKIFEDYCLSGTLDDFFMLWRNRRAVIIGKNQIMENEVDMEFANSHNISVVRRSTGGGAVYHDLGNINYTYIGPKADQFGNFLIFAQPIIQFLKSHGINAFHLGKNDIGIHDHDGDKKISGNAQCVKDKYILHHGTILFDVDIDTLSKVLTPDISKLSSKGIKSIQARVTNIRQYLPMSREQFWQEICNYFKAEDIKNLYASQ